ncbi:MAG: hypothetical protein CMLOHMNK_00860 [Steroidobacteraceae bacterium]|nr:hypothetical protein [Steroidobacteraceae bacterium]
MKYLVAVLAWLMPVIAWLSNTGVFGPTNGAISDQYPTLIVAAGYAFSIWGLIFLLDVLYGTTQIFASDEPIQRRIRPFVAAGFALTSLWMIVFTLELFWLALAIIWLDLGCFLLVALQVSHGSGHGRRPWWQWVPLSLHAGWLSLAAFLNVAQVVVANRLLSTTHMLSWTLVLFASVAALLLWALVRMRGNPWYAAAAVWGLAGVYVKQYDSDLNGAAVAAYVALTLAVAVLLLSVSYGVGAASPERPGRPTSADRS